MSEQHGESYCLECRGYFGAAPCNHEKSEQVGDKSIDEIARGNLNVLIQTAITQERERIIKLLENVDDSNLWRQLSHSPDSYEGFDISNLIALIKGDNK